MSNLTEKLSECFIKNTGHIDLRVLIEKFSLDFSNLSLSDVHFIESECREVKQKFEDADKVDCFRTTGLVGIGFGNTAYYALDEIEQIKTLSSKLIAKGDFDFLVKKIKISKAVLDGHIRDRKEWERI